MNDDIDILNDESLEAPDRPDFRRVGKGTPYPIGLDGKRVRYSRSSNAGKILDDESNLTDWKLRTVVAGAAQRPELMAQASVLDIDSDKKELRDIVEECLKAGRGQRRSIIGNAVHAMFDHIDRQDEWAAPPNFLELCMAYVETKYEWGLEVAAIEVHCINDEFRCAGKLDRVFRTVKAMVAPDGMVIPIGSHVVADHKTGKELEYASGSYCTQLAAYVDSVPYDVVHDERLQWEFDLVKDWALIIHADSAGTRVDVYWVDINAGRKGLKLANEVREWRRRDDLLTIGRRLRIAPTPSVPAEAPTEPVETSRDRSRYEHLRTRVVAIQGASQGATRALLQAWPQGVKGLKTFEHSWEDMNAIEAAIIKVETDYSMPFPATWDDPALEASKAIHPSNRWAKPETVQDRSEDETNSIGTMIQGHKRSSLLRVWIGEAVKGGINHKVDTTALAHALFEFASLDESEWPDNDLTVMLEGSLRAIGYVNGLRDLGNFNPEHAPLLMSAAFAITAGNAFLLFDDDGLPVVRTNVKEARKPHA